MSESRSKIVYKLTDGIDQTYGGCQWGPGVIHYTDGHGRLCSSGWIHVYDDPLLAILHNPIHGNFDLATAHLWKCEASGMHKNDHGIKAGYTEVCTIHRIELPEITDVQKIAYGILCAWFVYRDATWRKWARRWLSGKDRSVATAQTAATAVTLAAVMSMSAMWAAISAGKAVTLRTDKAEAVVLAAAAAVDVEWAARWAPKYGNKQSLNLRRLARAAMRVK